MSNPARIDVHQHIVPPAYANWLTEKGIDPGGLPIPQWSVEVALKMMDEQGIASGIVSVSTPGVHLGNDAQARSKAREVNEFVVQVVRDHPDRFGFFATLTNATKKSCNDCGIRSIAFNARERSNGIDGEIR